MIESVEEPHEVRGDELAWFCVLADGVDLVLLVGDPDMCKESLPVEHQAGIVLANRNRDLSPVVVGLAPVRGRPVGIEVVERFVFRFQPILKLVASDLVVGHLGVFIVDLPAHDVGIVPEAHRHLLGDAAAEFQIVRR